MEFLTFYSELSYIPHNPANLRYAGLKSIPRIPLVRGPMVTAEGGIIKAAFTCDPEARDLMRTFEEAITGLERLDILTEESLRFRRDWISKVYQDQSNLHPDLLAMIENRWANRNLSPHVFPDITMPSNLMGLPLTN